MKSIVFYTTLPSVGGNTTITLGLAKFFRDNNLQVNIIIRPSINDSISPITINLLEQLGCNIIILKSKNFNSLVTILEALIKVRALKAQIFISIGMGFLAPLMAFCGRFKKSYFYYINHDPELLPIKKLGKLINLFDTIIAITPASIPFLENYISKKISVIWLPQFSELHSKVQKQMPSDRDVVNCAFVGTLKKEKGITQLIENWRNFNKNICLYILGNGPDRIVIEEAIQNSTNVFYKGGFLATERENILPIFYSTIDYLIVPTIGHGEGIPTVILEALSLGVPIIATRAGGTVFFEHEPYIFDFKGLVTLIDEADVEITISRLAKPTEELKNACIVMYKKWFSDDVLRDKWLAISSL